MPNPGDFENRESFMEACIPEVLNDGTASSQDQAVAVCSSMWSDRGKTMSYQRTSSIRTERLETDGIVEGTLATNGEASDGHILDVRGLEVPKGNVPLLFGHDAHSGRNNLGSWVNFAVMGPKRASAALGDSQLHGTAKIELGGSGAQAEFRQDVAHMVQTGHVNAFSVRWDPVGDPVRRADLPKDHYAYREQGGGLYFERARILEGSIVTIGADSAALVARALESRGRSAWMHVLGDDMLAELFARIEDVQSRLEAVEAIGTERLPFIDVAADVSAEAVPEDSAPSSREPESRPVTVDRFAELFAARLNASDDRVEQHFERALRRLTG